MFDSAKEMQTDIDLQDRKSAWPSLGTFNQELQLGKVLKRS